MASLLASGKIARNIASSNTLVSRSFRIFKFQIEVRSCCPVQGRDLGDLKVRLVYRQLLSAWPGMSCLHRQALAMYKIAGCVGTTFTQVSYGVCKGWHARKTVASGLPVQARYFENSEMGHLYWPLHFATLATAQNQPASEFLRK